MYIKEYATDIELDDLQKAIYKQGFSDALAEIEIEARYRFGFNMRYVNEIVSLIKKLKGN